MNAVHDTEFYLVQGNKITYFTDYANLPAIKERDRHVRCGREHHR